MKCEYDKENDVAYVYLRCPIKRGECKKTIEVNENMMLDLDKTGKIVGLEILNASRILAKKVLEDAVIQPS